MRIAVFIKSTTLHTSFGGLETQNRSLCEGLAAKGHQVTVFSPQLDLNKTADSQNDVDYVFVPSVFRFLFSGMNKKNWVNRSYEVFKELHEKENFDIVLSQSSAGLGIINHKNELRIPVVAISHGTIIGEYKTRIKSISGLKDVLQFMRDTVFIVVNFFTRQRDFILKSDKVIAVSQTVKDSLVEETFIPENRVEVIYNGIDPSVLDNLPDTGFERKKQVYFVFLGQVLKSKGLDDLLEVFADPDFTPYGLEIYGDGDYFDELTRLITASNLQQRVNAPGKLPFNEAMARIKQQDVVVLPSKRMEGFPMSLVETAFLGLPAVAAKIGGIPEAVLDGETGILYESGNKQELKKALLQLAGDESLRKKMGDKARKRAFEEFSADVMLSRYMQVFEEVSA